MRALTANRQAAAVTQAAIAAQVHQTLDVHRNVAAQIAFDGKSGRWSRGSDDFVLGQLIDPAFGVDADLSQIFRALSGPMP